MILGDIAQPTPVNLAAFLSCLYFLIAGYNQVEKFLDRRKDRPAPGEVRAEGISTFATKEALTKHAEADDATHDHLFSKIGGVERGARKDLDEHRKETTQRIDAIVEALNQSIQAMPAQIVAQLSNSKNIFHE